MNDRACVADECRRHNGGDGDKECDLREKIPSRFGTEVFATDVEKRRLRTVGGIAVIPIEREDLKIAIYKRKPGSLSPAATIPASPIIVSFGVRFHRLPTFLL